jgi:CheY-like chemotaxis protein
VVSAEPPTRPGALLLRADVRHGERRFVTHTLDVSEDAVALVCDLAVGDEASVELSFPGIVRAFNVVVQVTATRAPDTYGRPSAASCKVIRADDDARRTLRNLVALTRGGPREVPDPAASGEYRCLLVEDNAFIRDLFQYGMQRYCRMRGRELSLALASDAETAWEMLRGDRYDMAIVDHFLPAQTGSQLIARMRAEPCLSTVPVVAISVGGREACEEAMAAGADLFLDKPVVMRDLFSTLDRLTARAEVR